MHVDATIDQTSGCLSSHSNLPIRTRLAAGNCKRLRQTAKVSSYIAGHSACFGTAFISRVRNLHGTRS